MRSLIVIPTYNERENIPSLIEDVLRCVPTTDLLIIDDHSPDGTGQVVDALAARDPRIHALHREGKLGLGTAYVRGFQYAIEQGYDLVFEMDADYSHDPKYLPDFFATAEQADLVVGSRYVKGGGTANWGLLRRFISRGGSLYAQVLLGLNVRDLTGGFKCYRRRVIEALPLDEIDSKGYAFQIETTYRAVRKGFSVREVPITFVDRVEGGSKMSKSIVVEAVWKVPVLRLRALGGKL